MKKIRLGLLMLAIVLGVTGAIAATKKKLLATEKWSVSVVVSESPTQIVIRGYNVTNKILDNDYECVASEVRCTIKGNVISKFVYTPNTQYHQVTFSKPLEEEEYGVFSWL